jgi:hypothetical protein
MAAFPPPFREELWLSFLPRPEPDFLPPWLLLFTVAQALRSASLCETPGDGCVRRRDFIRITEGTGTGSSTANGRLSSLKRLARPLWRDIGSDFLRSRC